MSIRESFAMYIMTRHVVAARRSTIPTADGIRNDRPSSTYVLRHRRIGLLVK